MRKPGKRSVKLRRGDFFGELALLDAAPRTATVEAESEVLTMRLGRTAFQKVLEQRAQGGARDAADAGGAHARVGSLGSGLTRRRPCGH